MLSEEEIRNQKQQKALLSRVQRLLEPWSPDEIHVERVAGDLQVTVRKGGKSFTLYEWRSDERFVHYANREFGRAPEKPSSEAVSGWSPKPGDWARTAGPNWCSTSIGNPCRVEEVFSNGGLVAKGLDPSRLFSGGLKEFEPWFPMVNEWVRPTEDCAKGCACPDNINRTPRQVTEVKRFSNFTRVSFGENARFSVLNANDLEPCKPPDAQPQATTDGVVGASITVNGNTTFVRVQVQARKCEGCEQPESKYIKLEKRYLETALNNFEEKLLCNDCRAMNANRLVPEPPPSRKPRAVFLPWFHNYGLIGGRMGTRLVVGTNRKELP